MKQELTETELIKRLGGSSKYQELILSIYEENKDCEAFTNSSKIAFIGQTFETSDDKFLYIEAVYEKENYSFQVHSAFITDSFDEILDRGNELKKASEQEGKEVKWRKL